MNKKAFTLAEVLITLGIIGVVAALTIPTLVANYQKKQLVSRLQKTYSTLSNGFKLMMASENVEYISQTKFIQDYHNGKNIVDSMKNNLGKYMKIADACYGDTSDSCPMYSVTYMPLNGNKENAVDLISSPYFQLQDGTTVFLTGLPYTWGDNAEEYFLVEPLIDVNGLDGPNVMGRDAFSFIIGDVDEEGNLKAGKVAPYLQYYGTNYSAEPLSEYCGDINSSDISNANGILCADRIIEEGWKMNY